MNKQIIFSMSIKRGVASIKCDVIHFKTEMQKWIKEVKRINKNDQFKKLYLN